jgi:hypothetical protein
MIKKLVINEEEYYMIYLKDLHEKNSSLNKTLKESLKTSRNPMISDHAPTIKSGGISYNFINDVSIL